MNQPLRSAFRTGWAAAATLSLALSVTAQTPANPANPGSPGFDARLPFAASEVAAIDAAWLVERLRPDRPRLVADAQAWAQVRALRREDPAYAAEVAAAVAEARAATTAPPLEREMTGRRLLPVSREALRRVLLLAFAHRVEDDPAYARAAEACLLRVAGFSDWNPDHFLDVAEMATAVARRARLAARRPAARDPPATGLRAPREGDRPAPRRRPPRPRRSVARGLALGAPGGEQLERRVRGGLVLAALSTAEEAPAAAAEVLRRAPATTPRTSTPTDPTASTPRDPATGAMAPPTRCFSSTCGTCCAPGRRPRPHPTLQRPTSPCGASALPVPPSCAAPPSSAMMLPAGAHLQLRRHPRLGHAAGRALRWSGSPPTQPPGAAVRPDRPLFGNDAGGDDCASRFAPLGLLWRGRGAAGDPAAAAAGPAPGWWGRGVQPVALFRGT